uniref:receptor-like protein kinase FERONIA n=1 Tax=Erigeron canadensis TaxID=72917 RepID=UPI001CB9928E
MDYLNFYIFARVAFSVAEEWTQKPSDKTSYTPIILPYVLISIEMKSITKTSGEFCWSNITSLILDRNCLFYMNNPTDVERPSKDLFIPFQVIEKATNDFTTVLGKGGYGVVYKGELLLLGQLTSVAIKRLDSNISGQGIKEFLTEIQLLSRYKHPNIVSLLGFCDEAGERILIYEYAEHGSLDKYLNAPKTTIQLTWEQRISICLDMARGLDYLHNRVATNHRVIHRDIKSANILIGHEWKAMITDLGLSKIGRANEGDSYVITNASGTHGYCDPTYIQTGVLTKGSDIFSFGVVMFEVLCGRLAVTKVDNKYQYLAEIAQRYYEGKRLYEIIDPYLMKEVDFASLKRFSDIAYKCLHKERVLRPSMDLVVQQLE